MKKHIPLVLFTAIACDSASGERKDAEADESGGATSEVQTDSGGGQDVFLELCGYAEVDWLGDDEKRQSCSSRLQAYCGERLVDECETWFDAPGGHRLGCFVGLVQVGVDEACGDVQRVCLGGMDSMINRCNNCGSEEKNTSIRMTSTGWELVTVETPSACGITKFEDGFDLCHADVAACTCACS